MSFGGLNDSERIILELKHINNSLERIATQLELDSEDRRRYIVTTPVPPNTITWPHIATWDTTPIMTRSTTSQK